MSDVSVRCGVEKENWSMQWSGEVLPEPAMIPDLSLFFCAVATSFQVNAGNTCVPLSSAQEDEESVLCGDPGESSSSAQVAIYPLDQ